MCKYRQFWLEQGYDVLSIQTSPRDLFLKPRGLGNNAKHVVDIVTQDEQAYQDIFVHAFSVGCHQFCEVLDHRQQLPQAEQQIFDARMRGWIFDSFVHPDECALGYSRAITLDPVAQPLLQFEIEAWLLLTKPWTMNRFRMVQKHVADNVARVPSLMLFSSDDCVSDVHKNGSILQGWAARGIACTGKCWHQSHHVSHRYYHQLEYDSLVLDLIDFAHFYKYGPSLSQDLHSSNQ